MNKDKIFHPIQYRRDMKRVHELLGHMNDAYEACRKAAELNDDKQFAEQCVIFDDCNSEEISPARGFYIFYTSQ